MELILLIAVIVVVIGIVALARNQGSTRRRADEAILADAKADARQAIERLGGQVFNLVGSNEPAKSALADASERFNAAGSQIEQAATPRQAELAKQTALFALEEADADPAEKRRLETGPVPRAEAVSKLRDWLTANKAPTP